MFPDLKDGFFRIVTKYPKVVIFFIAAVTLFFGYKAADIQFNNSIETLLPVDHPALLQDEEIKNIFNSREYILVGILNSPTIFQSSSLHKVKQMSDSIWDITLITHRDENEVVSWIQKAPTYAKDLEKLMGNGLDSKDRRAIRRIVRKAETDSVASENLRMFLRRLQLKLEPVSDVISLSEADNITSRDGTLRVGQLMDKIPDQEEMDDFIAEVFDNDMYVNGLVSADSTGTVILVELSFHYDDHLVLAYELFDKLNNATSPFEGPEEIHLAGVPMVNVYTSNYMNGDLARLIPFVTLVMIVILFLTFRSWGNTFIPVLVVLVSLIWTVGIMVLTDRPFTLVVSAMPVILIAIGVADGIHIITEYRLILVNEIDKLKAIRLTMRDLASPLIFTSLTDMAGFGSLAFTSIQSIRDFGIFTSVGALAGLIFSLTFVPAALVLLPAPSPERRASKAARGMSFIPAVLNKLTLLATRRKRTIILTSLGLAIISVFAISQIEVGSTMVGYFKKSSEIYRSSEMLNSKFGGTEVMNIVVEVGEADGLKQPDIMAGIASLQDTLESLPLVGYSTSIADYVKRINYVMNEKEKSYSRVPFESEKVTYNLVDDETDSVINSRIMEVSGRQQIAQYLFLYENAGGEYLEKLADFDYRKANITVQIRTDDTPALRDIKKVAESYASSVFGKNTSVTFAGCSSLCIVADDLIIPGQLKSLGIAVIVVIILLSIIFRSLRLGIVGILPLLLTIIGVFSLMALFSVNLDAVTALVASIVLGVGIDYSIHFISRYQKLKKTISDQKKLLDTVMHTSGRAILYNSLAVAPGFIVLTFSSFWPIIHIGWMVGVIMLIGAVFVLLLTPVLLLKKSKN